MDIARKGQLAWVAAVLLLVAGCGNSSSGNSSPGVGSGTVGCSANLSCKVESISSVAYGAGIYVAGGSGGLGSSSGDTIGPWVETSTDGVSWKVVDSGDTTKGGGFDSVSYGSHGFLALDFSSQKLFLSTNGLNWTDVTPPGLSNGELLTVDWDGSEYIAYDGAPILESPDGKTWSAYPTTFQSEYPFSIRKVSGTYVALWSPGNADSTNLFAISTDQVHWAVHSVSFGSTLSDSPTDLMYAGTQFVAVGSKGFIATSSDGTTWTDASMGNSSDDFLQVAYNGSVYVAIGSCGSIDYSADANTWTAVSIANLLKSNVTCSPGNTASVQLSAITAQQGGGFVGIGGTEGLTGMDGIHWTAIKF